MLVAATLFRWIFGWVCLPEKWAGHNKILGILDAVSGFGALPNAGADPTDLMLCRLWHSGQMQYCWADRCCGALLSADNRVCTRWAATRLSAEVSASWLMLQTTF